MVTLSQNHHDESVVKPRPLAAKVHRVGKVGEIQTDEDKRQIVEKPVALALHEHPDWRISGRKQTAHQDSGLDRRNAVTRLRKISQRLNGGYGCSGHSNLFSITESVTESNAHIRAHARLGGV
jgi:hypothetical protein